VPNLNTDRGLWLIGFDLVGNVRRLMYQSLIFPLVSGNMLSDEAGCLRAPLHAKRCKGLANPLVHGVRGNAELGGDFLRAPMAVDKAKASKLTGVQLVNPSNYVVVEWNQADRPCAPTARLVRIVQGKSHSAQHAALPSWVATP
jgi:hypothetical protein